MEEITDKKRNNFSEYVFRILKMLPFAVLCIVFRLSLNYINIRKITSSDKLLIAGMLSVIVCSFILGISANRKARTVVGIIFAAATPFACFLFLEWPVHNPLAGDRPVASQLIWINVLFIAIAFAFFILITTRLDFAALITVIACFGMGFANRLALLFRSKPIFPWDFLSAGTAVSVLDNYEFKPDKTFFILLFFALAIVSILFLCGVRVRLFKYLKQCAVAFVAAVIFAASFLWFGSDTAAGLYGYYTILYSENYLYKYNGTVLTLVYTSKFMSVDKPQGYDADEIEKIGRGYAPEKDSGFHPNVIVILNEAFSDLSVLGLDFKTNEDYMPFIHSLDGDNVAKGNVFVSVKGGNTPNSEYEFLTGMSMANLPVGSIPYQQFIHGNIPTLVTQMKSLGYSTVGMHAFTSTGWRRNTIYPLLGFDECIFSSSFRDVSRIRSYISDKCMFSNVERIVNESDEPVFLYGVTMQNHGGYTEKSGHAPENVSVEDSDDGVLATYLSLIYESDSAFESFIQYIDENIDEPTVVLMYGDHQPNDNVVEPLYELNGREMPSADDEEYRLRYVTPYVVWANYDISPEKMPETLSLNNLAAFFLKAAGLPLTGYQQWLTDFSGKYPVLCAGCAITSDGGFIRPEQFEENEDVLSTACIHYNYLFDPKNRVTEFFTLESGVNK